MESSNVLREFQRLNENIKFAENHIENIINIRSHPCLALLINTMKSNKREIKQMMMKPANIKNVDKIIKANKIKEKVYLEGLFRGRNDVIRKFNNVVRRNYESLESLFNELAAEIEKSNREHVEIGSDDDNARDPNETESEDDSSYNDIEYEDPNMQRRHPNTRRRTSREQPTNRANPNPTGNNRPQSNPNRQLVNQASGPSLHNLHINNFPSNTQQPIPSVSRPVAIRSSNNPPVGNNPNPQPQNPPQSQPKKNISLTNPEIQVIDITQPKSISNDSFINLIREQNPFELAEINLRRVAHKYNDKQALALLKETYKDLNENYLKKIRNKITETLSFDFLDPNSGQIQNCERPEKNINVQNHNKDFVLLRTEFPLVDESNNTIKRVKDILIKDYFIKSRTIYYIENNKKLVIGGERKKPFEDLYTTIKNNNFGLNMPSNCFIKAQIDVYHFIENIFYDIIDENSRDTEVMFSSDVLANMKEKAKYHLQIYNDYKRIKDQILILNI